MSEKKKDLKTELDAAFKLISALAVSGDTVDVIAAVREQIGRAHV